MNYNYYTLYYSAKYQKRDIFIEYMIIGSIYDTMSLIKYVTNITNK